MGSVLRLGFYNTATSAFDYLQARAPRNMWRAVLEQAIQDATVGPSADELAGMTNEQAREYTLAVIESAREWIADTENEPRRFEWVCELLDLTPGSVRFHLQARYK